MKQTNQGFTLIELVVVVAIVAILVTIAGPSFVEQIGKRRIEGTASEMGMDLQYLRTESVTKNKPVRLITNQDGTGYRVEYVGSTSSAPVKEILLKNGMTVTPGTSITYQPLRGMASGVANLTLSSTQTAETLRIVTTAVGGIALCSPDGSFKGYPPCP